MFLAAAWGSPLPIRDSSLPSQPFGIHLVGQHSEKTQEFSRSAAWPVSIENYGDNSQWPAGVDISAAPAIGWTG